MQTFKLRMAMSVANGWIAAWFPGEEMDGKLFRSSDFSEAATTIPRYMYMRRLRKQVKLPLGVHHATVPNHRC